jgi:hypothetical protein
METGIEVKLGLKDKEKLEKEIQELHIKLQEINNLLGVKQKALIEIRQREEEERLREEREQQILDNSCWLCGDHFNNINRKRVIWKGKKVCKTCLLMRSEELDEKLQEGIVCQTTS